MTAKRLERLSGIATRCPALTVTIVVALALVGGVLALGLRPAAGIDTFVSSSSASYRATADDQRHFGDAAVVILVREPLGQLLDTGDLTTITRLEACLAGQYVKLDPTVQAEMPVGGHAAYGGPTSPCGRLMHSRAAQVVYGPGTFLNRAVAAVNAQVRSMVGQVRTATRAAEITAYRLSLQKGLTRRAALSEAKAAGSLEYQRQLQSVARLALSSGISRSPSIANPAFLDQIVFDPARGLHQPKGQFADLFPTADSALIQVRLRSTLTDQQQAQAISWIRQAVAMPMFRSAHGGRYTVTGVPVVIDELAGQITGSIAELLIAALLVMAATLLTVFRSVGRPASVGGAGGGASVGLRLLPLAIALAAAGITFGLLAVVGATLTVASIAVVPVLIGLAVDYGIQFQARAQEAQRLAERRGGRQLSAAAAVAQAAGRAAPAIGTAALATGTGFLVLLLSPVPMVRGFGVLLVVGIAIAFGCAMTLGLAVLVLAEREGGLIRASLRGAGEILSPPLRGAGEIVGSGVRRLADGVRRLGGGVRRAGGGGRRAAAGIPRRLARREPGGPSLPARALEALVGHPGRVLALAGMLAVAGWIADTQTGVQSDITKLVPAGTPALHNLRTLERATGVSGEIDVTIRGSRVATPASLRWMVGYRNELLRHYGYDEDSRTTQPCAHATLCPALSLPDLFSPSRPTTAEANLTQSRINGLLDAVPGYFSDAVITPNRREATLGFGIRLMPLSRQSRVIAYMRSHLHPPPGVTASLAGLPAVAAQANAVLSSTTRRFLTLIAGLMAVGLVLLVVLRRPARALVPMTPIVLATGWSSLILFGLGIPLNPMSATLGTLVIAISTEFSVLLSERYRQERASGDGLGSALHRTYRSTGAAVLASGVTAIAGFGVLVFSNVTMLRDFGFVTLIDLSVSLAGVLLVLPAVLALSEQGDAFARLRHAAGGMSGRVTRPRRRQRVA